MDEFRYFAFRWDYLANEQASEGNSLLVEFSLSTDDPNTRLRLVESGFAALRRPDADKERYDVMAGYVERGEVPGVVTLVGRRGEVHVDAIGSKSVGGEDPISRDTIFRISSTTQPITAAATMILVEKCKVRLDEPVDRLLPELANRRVLTHEIAGRHDDLEGGSIARRFIRCKE